MLLDVNLGLPAEQGRIGEVLKSANVKVTSTADLDSLGKAVHSHETDFAYVPSGMYHRVFAHGDRHYKAITSSTSKFTSTVTMTSLLIVRKDDPATSIDDLGGAKYGYINKDCSSTYYPAEILLQRQGRSLSSFLDIQPVNPGSTWEGVVNAVTSGTVRASMILEDVWKTFPQNAADTKVIGSYHHSKGPVMLVPAAMDPEIRQAFLEALLEYAPPWEAVYGGFKPYYHADMVPWFHDLDSLPQNEW